jgi:hypothetical protein
LKVIEVGNSRLRLAAEWAAWTSKEAFHAAAIFESDRSRQQPTSIGGGMGGMDF